jgi:hypothetical protein
MNLDKLSFAGGRLRPFNARRARSDKNTQSSRRRIEYTAFRVCDERGQEKRRENG